MSDSNIDFANRVAGTVWSWAYKSARLEDAEILRVALQAMIDTLDEVEEESS